MSDLKCAQEVSVDLVSSQDSLTRWDLGFCFSRRLPEGAANLFMDHGHCSKSSSILWVPQGQFVCIITHQLAKPHFVPLLHVHINLSVSTFSLEMRKLRIQDSNTSQQEANHLLTPASGSLCWVPEGGATSEDWQYSPPQPSSKGSPGILYQARRSSRAPQFSVSHSKSFNILP